MILLRSFGVARGPFVTSHGAIILKWCFSTSKIWQRRRVSEDEKSIIVILQERYRVQQDTVQKVGQRKLKVFVPLFSNSLLRQQIFVYFF